MNATIADKPLPREKPLPSRPIARLSSSLSPSKDSRSLIDAGEAPLHITSTAGQKQVWPTLTPQSANSTSTSASTDFTDVKQMESSPISPSRAARASLLAAATTLTHVITGKSPTRSNENTGGSQSSPSSYASANESSSPSQPDDGVGLDVKKTRDVESSSNIEDAQQAAEHVTFPTRQASLRQRISNGSLVSPSVNSPNRFIAFTDYTKARDGSMTSSKSRPHSPSPASFSRPRPGSLSSTDSKSIKTASRIPVPDTKKATVIDVKKNRFSGSSMSSASNAPTFGSRRLASPEALKILENGKLRRQLKRVAPESSLARGYSERTWTPDSSISAYTVDTPSLSHSLDISPDTTLAPNSPEDYSMHQMPTDDDASSFAGEGLLQYDDGRESVEQESANDTSELQQQTVKHFKRVTSEDGSRPPPTSVFTQPLQTIPSQAVLPTENSHQTEEMHTELSRALSCLEGSIGPQSADVDQQTLMHMFGHLKSSLDNYKKTSNTLSQNAAAAEMYLAQHASLADEAIGPEKEAQSKAMDEASEEHSAQSKSKSNCTGKRKQTMASKWSDSTPSDKDISPAAEGLTIQEQLPPINPADIIAAAEHVPDDPAPLECRSRIPVAASTATPQPLETEQQTQATEPPDDSRRGSSPTLASNGTAKKKPGSVRVARERIQAARPSFSRATMSTESKRATRKPTPHINTMIIPEEEVRGRTLPGQKGRSRDVNDTATKVIAFQLLEPIALLIRPRLQDLVQGAVICSTRSTACSQASAIGRVR